jgi:hypothetical protein
MDKERQAGRVVYGRLMTGYAALGAPADTEERWRWLMAAHVVGQQDLRLHLHSHRQMLALAWESRDWPEVGGQLFRLGLVPLGHALRRLPAGNVGRATVGAFTPMRPDDGVLRLIRSAGAPDLP